MIHIIENIQKLLATHTKLGYVDEDWGQIDYYSPNMPVKWPVALIDITNASYNNKGMDTAKNPINRQNANLQISITIANLKLSNTSYLAPINQKKNARSIWELIEEIHKLLHGWSPEPKTGKLIRNSLNRVKRDDGIQEYKVIYTTTTHSI